MSAEVICLETVKDYLRLADEEAAAEDDEGLKYAAMLVEQAWHFGRQRGNALGRELGTSHGRREPRPGSPITAEGPRSALSR